MSKFTSFSALACALALSTPALAQECCESYVVYQPSYHCCQTTFIEHNTQPIVPIYAWQTEPGIFDQAEFNGVEEIVELENELVINQPLIYEEQLVWTGCNWQMMLVALPAAVEETFVSSETMVEKSVVYQEQAFWNGNCWQTMLVAIPAIQDEQIAYQEGDVHTVGRATYVDNTVAGEVIPEIPASDAATPSEDFNRDLATEPDTDDVKSDDDNLDDGDPKDGDSADDIDDEDDDDDDDDDDDK